MRASVSSNKKRRIPFKAKNKIDISNSARLAVPKSRNRNNRNLPAMTMEEVADEENLMKAFTKVASNKARPDPIANNPRSKRQYWRNSAGAESSSARWELPAWKYPPSMDTQARRRKARTRHSRCNRPDCTAGSISNTQPALWSYISRE